MGFGVVLSSPCPPLELPHALSPWQCGTQALKNKQTKETTTTPKHPQSRLFQRPPRPPCQIRGQEPLDEKPRLDVSPFLSKQQLFKDRGHKGGCVCIFMHTYVHTSVCNCLCVCWKCMCGFISVKPPGGSWGFRADRVRWAAPAVPFSLSPHLSSSGATVWAAVRPLRSGSIWTAVCLWQNPSSRTASGQTCWWFQSPIRPEETHNRMSMFLYGLVVQDFLPSQKLAQRMRWVFVGCLCCSQLRFMELEITHHAVLNSLNKPQRYMMLVFGSCCSSGRKVFSVCCYRSTRTVKNLTHWKNNRKYCSLSKDWRHQYEERDRKLEGNVF